MGKKKLKKNGKKVEEDIKKILFKFMEENDVSVSGLELEIETVESEFGGIYLTNMNVVLTVDL